MDRNRNDQQHQDGGIGDGLVNRPVEKRAERHDEQIHQVKELLGDLIDPETGEPVEVRFDRDDEDLVVEVRGSTWITAEARRRLAHLSSDGMEPENGNPGTHLQGGEAGQ